MNANTFGHITLNISTFVYLFFYLPQVAHHFKRRSTDGLSWLMHTLLFIAYCADLMYGFGRHMQWQYRLVTCIGLLTLSIEHLHIFAYRNRFHFNISHYLCMTGIIVIAFIFALLSINNFHFSKSDYDIAGMVSMCGWLSYTFPQILTNWQLKSTQGISITFILLALFLHVCDTSSAFCLGWDFPSKISAGLGFLTKFILIIQFLKYNYTLTTNSSKQSSVVTE